MHKILMLFAFISQLFSVKAQQINWKSYPVYTGTDLGLTYSPGSSTFRIWAPTAEHAQLVFYRESIGGSAIDTVEMKKGERGSWLVKINGDQAGKFYTIRVKIKGKWLKDVPDPYAKAVGINGQRAMVVDLSKTNPAGWKTDQSPKFDHPTDAIIYELHIRDASISPTSGITLKGKFLGLTEKGTRNEEGLSTGLDHLKELGITHVHLLPCFDFNSVDESPGAAVRYNWGYDPLNYNAPEGSYSSNAADGAIRIREFKELIQIFHRNGLRVIMDVVYNHTALTGDSYFNQLVPGYYYRQSANGEYSNATACGNETASERPMMRKFMLESVRYWVNEFHIDGFRFDLMGVHDIATMNLISRELHKIKPGILLYGEGWTAGASPLPDTLRALKKYAYRLDSIAVFSDDIRDGIKGSVFEHEDKGFVSGKEGMEQSIRFGIVASCRHPQVNYAKVNYSKAPYAAQPYNTITYCECHDNHILWDKLMISSPDMPDKALIEMQKLAFSIVLTSQGIPFLHAGSEFLRTKKGVENSFESTDSINAIDWSFKSKNRQVVEYVEALIQMRKQHPAFRMTSSKDIRANLKFINHPGLVIYTLNGIALKDSWKKVMVVFNGAATEASYDPGNGWNLFISNNKVAERTLNKNEKLIVSPFSCVILYRN